MKHAPCFHDQESKKLIQRRCKEEDVDMKLIQDLCELLTEHSGSGRKEGIHADITECIDRFLARTS